MISLEQGQKRVLSRALIFLLVVSSLAALSWRLAGAPLYTAGPDLARNYFGEAIDRSITSTGRLIESLQARLRGSPDDWQAYSQLGVAYLSKARETGDPTYYQKAEGVLNKALTLAPEEYTAVGAMGALALARHQFHEALEWGERARQINPDRTYAYGVIADAQIELGRYDEAVQTLQMMVDLRPDMNSYTRISYIRELYGDTDGALDMMRRAVEGGVPGAESTAWTRTQLANLYFNLGQLEPAEAEYQHALAEKPGYLYALAGLGRVRAAQGRTDEAIALLSQASQTMPLPEFVITLGDIYLAAGQPQMAQQQYDLLAVIQQLYQANSVDLELEMALFKADHRQDLAATVAQARQVFERRPSIHAADALAWALYQAGDYREAQSFAQQALRLGTKDALKLFHAGMITYRLGDEPQARDYLERALQINPHFSLLYADEARRILEKLQK
jgi:tetratricopeptide (TPR) repeat protein